MLYVKQSSGCSRIDKDFSSQISDLTSKYNTLNSSLSTLTSNFNTLQTNFNTLKSRAAEAIFFRTYSVIKDTIAANTTKYVTVTTPIISGYSRVVVSVHLANATSGGKNSSFCTYYQYKLVTVEDNVKVGIRNFGSAEAVISLDLYMAYIHDAFLCIK